MNGHYHLNDEQTVLTVSMSWNIPIIKTDGPLTDGQDAALRAYCNKFIRDYVFERDLNYPIEITASEILRRDEGDHSFIIDSFYYDADTGELYKSLEILKAIKDGQHELRIKQTESQKSAEN